MTLAPRPLRLPAAGLGSGRENALNARNARLPVLASAPALLLFSLSSRPPCPCLPVDAFALLVVLLLSCQEYSQPTSPLLFAQIRPTNAWTSAVWVCIPTRAWSAISRDTRPHGSGRLASCSSSPRPRVPPRLLGAIAPCVLHHQPLAMAPPTALPVLNLSSLSFALPVLATLTWPSQVG